MIGKDAVILISLVAVEASSSACKVLCLRFSWRWGVFLCDTERRWDEKKVAFRTLPIPFPSDPITDLVVKKEAK